MLPIEEQQKKKEDDAAAGQEVQEVAQSLEQTESESSLKENAGTSNMYKSKLFDRASAQSRPFDPQIVKDQVLCP